jgi:hypothetical protein
MAPLTVNNQGRLVQLIDLDAKHSHRFHRAPAIVTREKPSNRAAPVRQRSQNNGSMRDAFVSRNYNLRFDMRSPSNT